MKNQLLFVVTIDDFLCNTQYFDIVDSDILLNHTTRRQYCFATAIMVKLTRHNAT